MSEFVRRLTEGDKRWGTIDVTPAGRGLWRRVRMTVYPPGTSRAERRALHFAHTWPIAGAVLGLVLLVALGDSWPPAVVIVFAVAVYVGGFWLGWRLTRPLRPRIRSLVVATTYIGGEVQQFGDAALLSETRRRFADLDSRLRSGEISAARYEAEWTDLYEGLPARDGVVVA